MIGQIWRRLQLLFAQGTTLRTGRDTVQVAVLTGEILKNVRRVEPYGFSYFPPDGSQGYLAFPSGNRSYGLALLIGNKLYQMELRQGEVALHDDKGNWVHLKQEGVIEAKASTMVVAQTPLFRTTGDAEIGGNLSVKGQTASTGGYYGAQGAAALLRGGADVMGRFTVNGKDVSERHTHTSTAPGNPTSGVN